MPFVKRGSANATEDTAAVEMTVEVEVVVDSGMDRGGPLQGLNVSKPRHRPAANIGPKPLHQSRTVSSQTSIPRSNIRSSDLAQRRRISHILHRPEADDLGREVKAPKEASHPLQLRITILHIT